MKTLIVDNYDSMTFNLFQYIGEINDCEPIVLRNDEVTWEEISTLDIDNIIISPGPGRPDRKEDFGISGEVIRKAQHPILGVCLGHQGIAHEFGAQVSHAPQPMHGRVSNVFHSGDILFKDIPSPFQATRYHSLAIAQELPANLKMLAWSADGVVMAIRVGNRPIWGVQFHPESICTDYGKRIFHNFKQYTEEHSLRIRDNTKSRVSIRQNQVPSFEPASLVLDKKESSHEEVVLRCKKLDLMVDPEDVFLKEFSQTPYSFWLDSSLEVPGLSRFSYMGDASGPHAELVTYDATNRCISIRKNGSQEKLFESVFQYLQRQMDVRRLRMEQEVPFDLCGGFIGYFGYELKAECGGKSFHQAQSPDAAFIFADRYIVFDHEKRNIWLVHLSPFGSAESPRAWFSSMTKKLSKVAKARNPEHKKHNNRVPFHFLHTKPTYCKLIEECLEEIRNGESYEICLTNRLFSQVRPNPLSVYRILRKLNPAPYSTFLRLPGVGIMCSSPERFLKAMPNRVLEAKPIKGTIKRGGDANEDMLMRQMLANSEKDRAENLMIVDLLRNDLGLVSELNSVNVSKLMDIESYATVHQMVSTIQGQLHSSLSTVDAIRALFPGGSMTGSPKIRTMDIIDRLEGSPRGVYSGAIGFLSLNHTLDLNIAIRTIIDDGRTLSIGTGGAITAMSDPESEFDEIVLKALAPMQAISIAMTGQPDKYCLEEHCWKPVVTSKDEWALAG